MMNYEEVKTMVKVLENNDDAFARYNEDSICVTLNNCDTDWEGCEYNNEEAVDAFLDTLDANCIKAEHDWIYVSYTFDGFMVNIRYLSNEA